MMVIAVSIKYRSLIWVWVICSMNTKEWIIKFDFRGGRGQGTLQETTVLEGNTKSTVGVYHRRGWARVVGGRAEACS